MKYIVPLFLLFLACTNQEISTEPVAQNLHTALIMQAGVSQCPPNMNLIEGDFCHNLEEVCLKWIDDPVCNEWSEDKKICLKMGEPLKCAEFKYPTKCQGKITHLKFCIDVFEYPNQEGIKPKLQNTWYQAKNLCEKENKRLCFENEWTQACRGKDNLPYPYGYKRDATACLIDLPWQDPTTHTFEELDKTVPAGSMSKCISPYGVYDMTGNGDEWTVSSGGTTYVSVLKGGHPHGVRNRCTPHTTAHGPNFSFYDTGFRCCKDVK